MIDFVARIAQRREHVVQRMLGAVGDDDLRRRIFQAVPRLVILLGDGRAQLGNAAGLRVVRVPGLHRLDRRLADVLGRGEVGLADAEVVDLVPGGLELLGLGRHGQRGRGFQGLHDARNGGTSWRAKLRRQNQTQTAPARVGRESGFGHVDGAGRPPRRALDGRRSSVRQ